VTGVTTFYYETNDPLTNLPHAGIANIGNPELRWEKTAMLNIGVDFGFRNNILTGSLEYFTRKGTDLIGNQSLAPSTGYFNPNTGTYTLSGKLCQYERKWCGSDIKLQ
jgi:hypothetical protein